VFRILQLALLWTGSKHTLAGSRLLWAARRMTLGFLVVVALKEASRAALLAGLPLLYRFFPLAVRRLWQPPVHNLAAPLQRQASTASSAHSADLDGFVHVQHGQQQGKQQQAQEHQRVLRSGRQHSGGRRQRRRSAIASRKAASLGELQQLDFMNGAQQLARAGSMQSPADPQLAELPHNAKGKPWDVDVTSRFFAYAALGMAATGVAPLMFRALGW
jgi:hypothetical protein